MPTISTSLHLLQLPALDAAGGDRAAAGDREDVLDRHQERLVDVARRARGCSWSHARHELVDLAGPLGVALEGLQGRTDDDRHLVAGELVRGEQLAHLELDQVEQLRVVHHVRLVQEHHDVGHADLAGQQDVLARLGHRAVRRRHHQDGAVHLGRARDHVLDVVGVAGAVDVRVVAVVGLVLHVRDGDRDAALLLLRRLVDLVEGREVGQALLGQHLGDRGGERGLAVVDVTDRPDVDVRLGPLELLLRHRRFPPLYSPGPAPRSPWRSGPEPPGTRAAASACARPALRPRPQVRRVAEQLGQRHQHPDRPHARALVDVLDLAPAGGDVAHDVAHELLGREDLERHDRLQQDRVGLAGRVPERHLPRRS